MTKSKDILISYKIGDVCGDIIVECEAAINRDILQGLKNIISQNVTNIVGQEVLPNQIVILNFVRLES